MLLNTYPENDLYDKLIAPNSYLDPYCGCCFPVISVSVC